MPKNLKRILSKHLANLIRHGVSMAGSYESEEVFIWIEEDMAFAEAAQAEAFLNWVVAKERTFGHNIHDVYAECHASDGNTFYQAVVNREPEPVDENADNVIGVTTLSGGTKLIHVEPPTRRA